MTGVTVRAHSGGGNASGSTITYTFPGTPQVGDPIGIWVTTDNNAITIPSPPTGWTLAYSTTVGTGSRHFLHKVYASGDGASVAVTYSAAIGLNHSQAAVVVFDGSVHSDFGTIGTVTTRGSSSNTSTAVAAGATTDPNIVVFHEKTTSESSCTVGSATAIENLLPAAAIAGATYVGWYDTSGGTSTITATYGLSSANGCGYQIPLTLVPVTSSGSASLSLSGAQGNTGGGAIALAGAGAGAAPVTATATLTLTGSQTTPVQRWKRLPLPLAAHRGGSADWPEETLFAYGNCVAWNSDLALEISVWRSSDGVWVCSHDQNTSRVFGSSFDIPTSTWASMSGLTTTVGGKPIAKLTDVLDAYATGNRVIFIDNKGTQDLPGFLTLLNGYGGPARFVIKNFYTNATIAAWATTNGFESWGYWFPADTAGGNLNATTAGRWTMLGIEFDDTSAIWSQALGYGKPVLGHIIATHDAGRGGDRAGCDGADGVGRAGGRHQRLRDRHRIARADRCRGWAVAGRRVGDVGARRARYRCRPSRRVGGVGARRARYRCRPSRRVGRDHPVCRRDRGRRRRSTRPHHRRDRGRRPVDRRHWRGPMDHQHGCRPMDDHDDEGGSMTTEDQTIYVTAGGPEYTRPRTITDTTGKDISADPVLVGLSSYETPPSSLVAPTLDLPQANKATRVVQLLVTNTTPPGTYALWAKITDNPESPIRRTPGLIHVV
jgi:hypothetical protein